MDVDVAQRLASRCPHRWCQRRQVTLHRRRKASAGDRGSPGDALNVTASTPPSQVLGHHCARRRCAATGKPQRIVQRGDLVAAGPVGAARCARSYSHPPRVCPPRRRHAPIVRFGDVVEKRRQLTHQGGRSPRACRGSGQSTDALHVVIRIACQPNVTQPESHRRYVQLRAHRFRNQGSAPRCSK